MIILGKHLSKSILALALGETSRSPAACSLLLTDLLSSCSSYFFHLLTNHFYILSKHLIFCTASLWQGEQIGWFNIHFVSIHFEATVVKTFLPLHLSICLLHGKKFSRCIFFPRGLSDRGSQMRQTETWGECVCTCKETLGHGRTKICVSHSYDADNWSSLFPELPTAFFPLPLSHPIQKGELCIPYYMYTRKSPRRCCRRDGVVHLTPFILLMAKVLLSSVGFFLEAVDYIKLDSICNQFSFLFQGLRTWCLISHLEKKWVTLKSKQNSWGLRWKKCGSISR